MEIGEFKKNKGPRHGKNTNFRPLTQYNGDIKRYCKKHKITFSDFMNFLITNFFENDNTTRNKS